MRLTDEQITKYQEIYKATFGVAISKEAALEQGVALARLVKAITTEPNMRIRENEQDEYKQPTNKAAS